MQKQLSIEDVARQTRISKRFLNAIEADDFTALPGLIFARNFVRQYAALLDIDPAPLLAKLPSYDLETAPMPATPLASSQRSLWDPRWNSAVASLAWIVLACGAAAAAYLYFNRIPRPQQAIATPAAVYPAQPAALSATNPPAQTNSPAEIPPAAQGGAAPHSTPAVDSSPAPVDQHSVRVVVTARDDSWVQVTAEGKTAFIGILKAGESRSFASDGAVRVRTGNAGGTDISLNGKQLDPLGPAGQIRSVNLTAEGPQYAPKTPPVSPDPA
jgi:cytoskeletal protein RodZ